MWQDVALDCLIVATILLTMGCAACQRGNPLSLWFVLTVRQKKNP